MSISYRHYRNLDAPALMTLWNQSLLTRGCCELPKPSVLETHIFSKPWFDPKGLVLAFDCGVVQDRLVGAALAGFGGTGARDSTPHPSPLTPNRCSCLDTERGVISLVMVHPSYRRQKIGSELLQLVETYLAERGTSAAQAGSSLDRSPYLWGMVGGCAPAGVLQSDYGAAAFLQTRSYRPLQRSTVLTRSLEKALPMGDERFPGLRRRFSMNYHPRRALSWMQEAIEGDQEPIFFEIVETALDKPVGEIRGWDMNLHAARTKVAQVGLYGLQVKPEWRGQGLGKYLLCLVLQHLQEQLFGAVEVVIPEECQKVQKLFERLSFTQVDEGWTYTKQIRRNAD